MRTAGAAPLPIGRPEKVTLRFRESEMRRLAEVAHQRGMTRTGWIVALVRAQLGSSVQLSPDERDALRAVARELNRLGANIDQIARAANARNARYEEFPPSLSEIREVSLLVERTLNELRRAFNDNASYWKGADEPASASAGAGRGPRAASDLLRLAGAHPAAAACRVGPPRWRRAGSADAADARQIRAHRSARPGGYGQDHRPHEERGAPQVASRICYPQRRTRR
ncbi:plasmid mobilization protein [Methylocystis sp. IM4]|uniref:plasmid mobilization protein n=1 Tax=Methylocystis sp. IM4 TaxID=3136560 RepID=UPI00405359F2